MSKIVKNITGSSISILDTGVSIPAFGQYIIPPQDYPLWSSSDNIITEVGSGDVVVNDGSDDFGISDGIDLLKGIFQKQRILGSTDDTLIGNIVDELKTTSQIRGATDDTPIGNDGDALKVAGLVFSGASIQTEPTLSSQAFLSLMLCEMREMSKQLRILNSQVKYITDLDQDDLEDEAGHEDL